MKYSVIILQLLLAALASSVIPPDICVVHCTVHGDNPANPDKFAFYNEVMNRMDTVEVADGKFIMTINKSSGTIIPIIPIHEDREVNDISESEAFYIVPDKRDIFVDIDSVINVSGSKMSADINRVIGSYFRYRRENGNMTKEESLSEIKEVYSRHTSDIIGIQAIIAYMEIDCSPLQFVEMYNKGGRTVRKNDAVAGYWHLLKQYLYRMYQPIKEDTKDGKRYRFRKIPSRRCISIINRYPLDYDKVWQALGNLHLFYREQSLDYEILMAERYGHSIAGSYLVESLLDKFYREYAGNLIRPDGAYRKLPTWQSDLLRHAMQKCVEQKKNDFGTAYCYWVLGDPFFYGENEEHYNEDTIFFYCQKYHKLVDSLKNTAEHSKYNLMYPGIIYDISTVQMPAPEIKKRGHSHIDNAVDLGLSVQWRRMNVGADSPADYGTYYAWGEVSDRNIGTPVYDYEHYRWSQGREFGSLCKYCSNFMEGIVIDGRDKLLREDDVASCVLGGRWRMPTHEEWFELRDTSLCSWEWICRDGVNGYEVTSKIPGYAGNSIFLPASGSYMDSEIVKVNTGGYYWSSTASNYDYAWSMKFNHEKISICGELRVYGLVVRPVCE